MDPTILTPRLKLTLVERAETGSPEFEWLHKLRSDKDATWWSTHGRSLTPQDTHLHLANLLPNQQQQPPTTPTDPDPNRSYRINYAVHILPQPSSPSTTSTTSTNTPTTDTFIGLVTLKSLTPNKHLILPTHLTSPLSPSPSLTLEIAYMFLPQSWNRGFATESIAAVFAAIPRARGGFFAPWKGVYVRSIVNAENARSLRVMEKAGMVRRGVYVWEAGSEAEAIWVAGERSVMNRLVIWGRGLELEVED